MVWIRYSGGGAAPPRQWIGSPTLTMVPLSNLVAVTAVFVVIVIVVAIAVRLFFHTRYVANRPIARHTDVAIPDHIFE